MQADAEHQQNDADLRDLAGEIRVTDETGRERADGDPGQETAHERRQAQLACQKPAAKGENQTHHDSDDQRSIVRHGL